ncbi:MAG: peptide ABC transporter substrate-binding protein [Alphaproteobacteria bacterium]|nr:peptide ABC transporter substrate-binding protein [Alphaproteobacteria bacterium]
MIFRLLVLVAVLYAGIGSALAERVVLHRGNAAEPDTLDPHKYTLAAEANIQRDLFLPLMEYNAFSKPVAGAAERWSVSADGRVWTFHLRAGLVWSDGVPVTAADFVAGMRRGIDPDTKAQFANLAYFIKNAEAVNKAELPPEALGVRAPDPQTVEITLAFPTPLILDLLATPILFPVPRHAVERFGDDWVKPGHMVSNGAFVLAEWSPNDHVRLTKNPLFFEADKVMIDEVIFYPIEDEGAAFKRFRSGELDLQERFPPTQRAWIEAHMPGVLKNQPSLWLNYLVINQTLPKFKDARVREALSLAIDRRLITDKLLRNGETPAYRLMPPPVEGYESPEFPYAAEPMPQRIDAAKDLLAAAGYGPGSPLRFTFRHRSGDLNKRVAVALQGMWRAIGVECELVTGDLKTHYNLLREQSFEVSDAGWSFTAPDPYYITYLLLTDSVETNYGKWSNGEFDRIAKEAEATLDVPTRFALFAKAEQIAMADHALIPLFFPASRNIVQTWVKGYESNAPDVHSSRWMRIEK